MSTTELPENAGHENADPSAEEREPLGQDGDDGADEDVQGDGSEDENSSEDQSSADDNPSTEDDEEERSFIQRLSSGKLDELDENGEEKTADAEDEAEEAAPKPDPKDEEKPKEKEEAAPDLEKDLTDEEKSELAKVSRGQRKGLKKLFHERRTLREETAAAKEAYQSIAPVKKFADDLIQHAADAGLVARGADGRTDFSGLRDIIEEQRSFIGKKPHEIAAHYRKLADSIDPDSKPVKLTPDLADLVEAQQLTTEDAEIIQRKREAKTEAAKETEDPERRYLKIEAERARVREAQAAEQVKTESKAAYSEIGKLATEYKGRLAPLDFTAIATEVENRLKAKIAKAPPALWRDMAESEFELAIARRRTLPKKVTRTPPPSSRSSAAEDDVPTEEEERRALAEGRHL